MSAYKIVKCSIKDKNILIEACKELGLTINVYDEPRPLVGFEGKQREEMAEIIIPKASLNAKFTGASNDLGFTYLHQ